LSGVNQACRLLGISKDTYYNSQDPKDRLNDSYRDLKPKITRIIEQNPGYGYPRIKQALEKKYGVMLNHKVLMKLLKLWSLELPRSIKHVKKNFITVILDFLEKRANLLRRLIRENRITGCEQVIVSDVTEIKYSGNKKAYLSVHMDFFGKIIYGFCLSMSAETNLVLSSLKKAVNCLKSYGRVVIKNIILHQDRGSVYTSSGYIAKALSFGFKLSYSRTGEPGDNAVNESFFSRFKAEWAEVFAEANDFDELSQLVSNAISYYNNDRYHSSIGYDTPVAFYNKHIRNNLTQNALAPVC